MQHRRRLMIEVQRRLRSVSVLRSSAFLFPYPVVAILSAVAAAAAASADVVGGPCRRSAASPAAGS